MSQRWAGSALSLATLPGLLLNASRFYAGPDGRIYCDIPSQIGYSCGMKGVPVMAAGGSVDRYVQTGQPESVDLSNPSQLPQVLILFIGPERTPYAFGQVSAPTSAVPVTDHAAVNGGATVTLAADGNAAAAFPAGGTLTVSRGGAADGRLVLRDEMVDYLGDLVATLATWAAALEGMTGVLAPTFPDPSTRTFAAAVLPVSADAE